MLLVHVRGQAAAETDPPATPPPPPPPQVPTDAPFLTPMALLTGGQVCATEERALCRQARQGLVISLVPLPTLTPTALFSPAARLSPRLWST